VQKSVYLAVGILTLLLTACEEKSTKQTTISFENTTEIFTPKDKQIHQQKRKQAVHTKEYASEATAQQNHSVDIPQKQPSSPTRGEITFTDIEGQKHLLRINDKDITIDGDTKKNLLITLFSTWCPPCQGQLPYLEDIHSKHSQDLSVFGFLVNDDADESKLRRFLATQQVRFPVSRDQNAIHHIVQSLGLSENYPLPLTILYQNGNYIIHYEGAVPPEMIEHDINTPKDD
jgi:thiol-disulfide isomerase/thioredoxin